MKALGFVVVCLLHLFSVGTRTEPNAVYDATFYTASFGTSFTALASGWCYAVERQLVRPLKARGMVTLSMVITDRKSISGCSTLLRIKLGNQKNAERRVASKNQINVKLLKMHKLPVRSKVYMWLDIDIRPTAHSSDWFRYFAHDCALDHRNGIALTPTQHPEKGRYNGGLFAYSGRGCIDHWKSRILRSMSSSSSLQRDQPPLKMAVDSPFCNVTHMPAYTQGFFKPTLWSFGDRRGHPYAFMHFTGRSKVALKIGERLEQRWRARSLEDKT